MKRCFFLSTLLSTAIFAQDKTSQIQDSQKQDLYRKDIEVVSTHGEFLYWNVRENSLDYGLRMKDPEWGPTNFFALGKYQTGKFTYSPGFRVALSYYNAPECYEMWAQYTWLHSQGNNSAHKPSDPNLYLDGTWPASSSPMLSAHSHIKLTYNLADAFFTRVFIPNPKLKLRLLGGLTVAWMNQDWSIKYLSENTFSKLKNNWDFWGIGFRTGGTADCFLGYDFYITAKATAAVLLGRYHNHGLQKTNFIPPSAYPPSAFNTHIPIRKAYYEDTRCVYTVQFVVGPSWQKNFSSSRVEIFAGYEITSWFNVLEVFRSIPGTNDYSQQTIINNGPMSLDGLTARLTIDF